MADLEEVRSGLQGLGDRILGVFLFGSHATGDEQPRSDIDLCIVAGPGQDPGKTLRTVWRETRLGQQPYDVWVFEELPLYLKARILEEGELLLARDEPRLSEYLRRWRKIWADQAHRNRTTREDMQRIAAVRRRKGREPAEG